MEKFKLISRFSGTRSITICQCYRDCDCQPTTYPYYGVKYLNETGKVKNKEFMNEEFREKWIQNNCNPQ